MELYKLKNIFMETALDFKYSKIDSGSILNSRTSPPFFTFSPIQNNLHKFECNHMTSEFVLQYCMRNIPFNEIKSNPLATQYQLLYSVFDYKHVDINKILKFLETFLCKRLGLIATNIYIMYSEDNKYLNKSLNAYMFNGIAYDENRLVCNIPGSFKAYYLKILYHYKNGLVPISNIALIDQVQNTAKIDSIFYPERLKFILEGKDNIYCTNMYLNNMKILINRNNCDFEFNAAILSYLRSILALYVKDIFISDNKIGYALKHMERELFSNIVVNEIDFDLDLLKNVLNSLIEIVDLENSKIKIYIYASSILNNYKKFIKNMKIHENIILKNINRKELTSNDILLYNDRYGINKLILKYILKKNNMFEKYKKLFEGNNRTYPYYYNVENNNIKNPVLWANERRKTKFYKK